MRTLSTSEITLEIVREELDYDPPTGVLRWRKTWRRAKAGAIVGTRMKNGYLQMSFGGRHYLVHRLIWFYTYGAWPAVEIDHVDGVRDNNRTCNLREAVRLENRRNTSGWKRRKASSKGVRQTKSGTWSARICVNYTELNIGNFKTEQEASAAYEAKAKELFGEFYRPPDT